jgi:hypothetical protein
VKRTDEILSKPKVKQDETRQKRMRVYSNKAAGRTASLKWLWKEFATHSKGN